MAQHLADAGADLLLVETMNTTREAVAATEAARATGLPVLVSFVCAGATGEAIGAANANRLLSGEPLEEAVRAVTRLGPVAVLVNCVPVAQVPQLVKVLRCTTTLPIGVYANVGHVDPEVGWTLTHAVTPAEYATAARAWRALGATIIGGCCGTTPDHIAALNTALRSPDKETVATP